MHTLRTKRKIYIQLETETPPGPFDFLMALGFSPGKKPYFALAEVGNLWKSCVTSHNTTKVSYGIRVVSVVFHFTELAYM